MRGILIICLGIAMSNSIGWGQQSNEQKIREVFSTEVDFWNKVEPDIYKFWDRVLTTRISYKSEPELPGEKYTKLSSIDIENQFNPSIERDVMVNTETFNPLKYRLNFFSRHTTIYRVDGTSTIIILQGQ